MSNYIRENNEKRIVAWKTNPNAEQMEIIPPGNYKILDVGGMFNKVLAFDPYPENDKLIKFESGVVNDTINMIDGFLAKETVESYEFLKVAHKLGIIMYGPPGTGKTSTASLIMQSLIAKYDAVAIDGTGKELGFIKWAISTIRANQKNPIIVFIDEIDNSIDREEYAYLPFLDGSDSFNNIIILGCTNNIKDIPDRIKNRKSRIKHLVEIKSFPIEVYKEYIKEKLGEKISDEDLAKFAYLAVENSLTIDELKHCVIDYYIEKNSIDKTIKTIKGYSKLEN